MIKVYVAHTYGRRYGLSDRQCEDNVEKSIEAGRELIKRGYNPFIPNLWHYVHAGWTETLTEDKYLVMVSEWLLKCDCLLIASEMTEGVKHEFNIASEYGIKTFFSIESLDAYYRF